MKEGDIRDSYHMNWLIDSLSLKVKVNVFETQTYLSYIRFPSWKPYPKSLCETHSSNPPNCNITPVSRNNARTSLLNNVVRTEEVPSLPPSPFITYKPARYLRRPSLLPIYLTRLHTQLHPATRWPLSSTSCQRRHHHHNYPSSQEITYLRALQSL